MTSGQMLRIDIHRVTDQVERNQELGHSMYAGLNMYEVEAFERWDRIKRGLRIDDSVATAKRITSDPSNRDFD